MKVQSLLSLSLSLYALPRKSVFCFYSTSFSLSFNIPNMSLFFPSSPTLLTIYLFSRLFAPEWFPSRASGWNIAWGVMVCDLRFLHSYLSTLILLSTEWAMYVCNSMSESVYVRHYTVWPPHLFGCRCLETHQLQKGMWVSWISWVTPYLKSTTKNQRYILHSLKQTRQINK